MPGLRLGDWLAGAVVVGDQAARADLALGASGKARLVLADQVLRCRRSSRELLGIQVPAAGDAVNVRRVLLTAARRLILAFAFGESLFSLHVGGTKPKSCAAGQARSAASSASSWRAPA